MTHINSDEQGSGDGRRWRSMLNLGRDNSVKLGVSSEGHWLIESNSGLQALDKTNYMALLPLLEKPRSAIEAEMRSASAAHGLAFEGLPPLPIEELLLMALQSQSEYWQGLALEWLVVPIEGRLRIAVELLERHGASQHVRHSARKALRARRNPGA